MMGQDKTDAAILRILQQDASLCLDDISERVNLSRNACWRRIKILEDQGYIRKRVALLDPEKLDLGLQVFIHVKTANHSSDWAANLATVTRAIPEITAVHRMSGDLDYLIHAWVRDMKSYDHLYQRLTKNLSFSDVSASFVMEEIKATTELPI